MLIYSTPLLLVGFGYLYRLVGFGGIWDSVEFSRIRSDLIGLGEILVGLASGRGAPIGLFVET